MFQSSEHGGGIGIVPLMCILRHRRLGRQRGAGSPAVLGADARRRDLSRRAHGLRSRRRAIHAGHDADASDRTGVERRGRPYQRDDHEDPVDEAWRERGELRLRFGRFRRGGVSVAAPNGTARRRDSYRAVRALRDVNRIHNVAPGLLRSASPGTAVPIGGRVGLVPVRHATRCG